MRRLAVGQVELADDPRTVVLQLRLVEDPHRHLERQRRQYLGGGLGRQSPQRIGDVGGRKGARHIREFVGIGGKQVEELGRGFGGRRRGQGHEELLTEDAGSIGGLAGLELPDSGWLGARCILSGDPGTGAGGLAVTQFSAGG